jgi:hypothetical protein
MDSDYDYLILSYKYIKSYLKNWGMKKNVESKIF